MGAALYATSTRTAAWLHLKSNPNEKRLGENSKSLTSEKSNEYPVETFDETEQ